MRNFASMVCLSMLLIFESGPGSGMAAGNYDATTETVGRSTNGFETPVNQHLTPAGTLVELPGMRPQALALSPDGKLLVTAGITSELVVVNPATGNILQRAAFPSDQAQAQMPVSAEILSPDKKGAVELHRPGLFPRWLADLSGECQRRHQSFRCRPGRKSFTAVFHRAAAGQLRPAARRKFPPASPFRRDGKKTLRRAEPFQPPRRTGCGDGKSFADLGGRRRAVRCGRGRQKNLCQQLGRAAAGRGQPHRPGGAGHAGAGGPAFHRQRRLGFGH